MKYQQNQITFSSAIPQLRTQKHVISHKTSLPDSQSNKPSSALLITGLEGPQLKLIIADRPLRLEMGSPTESKALVREDQFYQAVDRGLLNLMASGRKSVPIEH